ncbi:conserved hypothetical protein [Candidatus Desulfarcum epimagneticum]|uniref:Uncharacterized protein n=1 Tax=uncultured Desulfobacteraceae bacterium TaxID=218296 RepID=A0A484HJN3_9BACT|nr:conserved hypothetical protein [uncultured Desulfobacteraceae bacterium]
MIINTFDIDGVIFQGEYDGVYPGKNDIIVTGRSHEERAETEAMLAGKGIKNRVIFNPLPFDLKSRETSGRHKGNAIKKLREEGHTVRIHFEDDEIQAREINRIVPGIRVVLLANTPVPKENVRHET